jgi:hypothetical protein
MKQEPWRLVSVAALGALAALGCVTSEPVDLKPSGPRGEPIMTATGGANQMASAGQAGSPGGAGAAGSDPTGAAGTIGAGGSGGSGGGSASATDAGADDAAGNKDASAASDAAGAEVMSLGATWTNIYMRMLNNQGYASNCTGGGCHNPGSQKGLSLSSQSTGYTSVTRTLVPGSPSASKLVSVLSSGSMPQSRPKMPAADLNVIKAWITAGAPNN